MYLIPTNPEFVEQVAKSIARNRVYIEAESELRDMTGLELKDTGFDDYIDAVFEKLWSGNSSYDQSQKECYMRDALAAIGAINLKLMSSAE